MDPTHVDEFETCAGDVRATVDALLDQSDDVRDLIDAAQAALGKCNRSVARMRRSEVPEMMGPLNSVSAVDARHKSLLGALADLETALGRFEDIARDMRLLHPDVVTALREKVAAVSIDPAIATPVPPNV
jgi:ABC-type transporter Mla subunit MlaD